MRHLALSLMLCGAALSATAAQKPETLHIIVMQGSPRGNTRAEVRVTPAPESRNIIVVDKRATTADLEAAIRTVQALRAEFGDTITKEVRAVPKASRTPAAGSREAKRAPAMAKTLADLDRRQPEEVKGLGRVKYRDFIVERLPARTGKPDKK